jgi:hypothetical protein
MAIKRVLLPVGPDSDFQALSDTAFHIAEKFSAQVMGLFVRPSALVIPLLDDVVSVEYVRTVTEAARRWQEAAAKAESKFKAAAEGFPHVESTFHVATGDVEGSFVRQARLADISVTTPPDPLEDGFWGSSYWLDVQNATLFRSGRPVLLVPPHAVKPNFEIVMIAWKQSLEAARAIAAAQPFMAKAREVHLFTIDDGSGEVASLREAEEYLSLHYDEVWQGRRRRIRSESVLGAGLQSRTLLIMGAFSHWRWQERRGRCYRHVLASSTWC